MGFLSNLKSSFEKENFIQMLFKFELNFNLLNLFLKFLFQNFQTEKSKEAKIALNLITFNSNNWIKNLR